MFHILKWASIHNKSEGNRIVVNDIAVISEEGQVIKYSELQKYLKEIASKVNQRSLVGIITSNTMGCLTGYLSFLYNKHVVFMLPELINEEKLENYIKKYHFNYLWVSSEWLEENQDWKKCKKICKSFDYNLLQISEQTVEMHPELAVLISTSGTTGSEKVVRQSYKNIHANTLAIIDYLNINDKDRVITALPMSYTYGLSVIHTHLFSGATILLTKSKPYELRFWQFFKKYSATSFSTVPYMYEMIRKLGIFNKDITELRKLTVAGGALSKLDEEFYARYSEVNNKEFFVMYGQTEATARISYRPSNKMRSKAGSIGIAIPNGRMWLENSTGEIIEQPYVEGEIVYMGENVAMGYAYGYEDLIKGYDWGNVLHTGDMGYMDEEKFFYITKRRDKVIKLNGHRVDLLDMEEKIKHRFTMCQVVCSLQKCVDCVNSKRIKIEIDCEGEIGINMEQEIIDYLSLFTGLNKRIFAVDIVGK